MANVNLIDSTDVTITQISDDITLHVVKDDTPNTSSTNPIENQAITNYVDGAITTAISTAETSSNAYSETLQSYITTEKVVGKFADNKPIYRKTYSFNVNNQTDIYHSHSLTNIDNIWLNYGLSCIVNGNEGLPLCYYFSNTDWARTWVNTSNIRFKCGTQLGNRTLYATVEYTKTTD